MEVSKHRNSHQVWFSIGRHSGTHTCYMHFVGLIMMLLLPAYIAVLEMHGMSFIGTQYYNYTSTVYAQVQTQQA